MHIHLYWNGNTSILELEGELTISTEELFQSVPHTLYFEMSYTLIIDMINITSFDDEGLNYLKKFIEKCVQKDKNVIIGSMPLIMQDMFFINELLQNNRKFDTTKEALHHYGLVRSQFAEKITY